MKLIYYEPGCWNFCPYNNLCVNVWMWIIAISASTSTNVDNNFLYLYMHPHGYYGYYPLSAFEIMSVLDLEVVIH